MIKSTEYQGMRWFKCDLHMHTPEDARHWLDGTCRLVDPRTEADLQDKARTYLKRCHELELDCIAITDHNFSMQTDQRKWFLTHLIEQNKTVADSEQRSPLAIFPGFELDIRYHLLCLFNPVTKAKHLQRISDTLTGMGLEPSRRINKCVAGKPEHHNQCWSLRETLDKIQGKESGGIVIAAHAFSNDGIYNDTSNRSDFNDNPDLYAIEIPEFPPPGHKAASILNGDNPDWKRPEPYAPPAPLKSSDCKSLGAKEDGPPAANQAGSRFTWIKMSKPGCEALRQAFLDHKSRLWYEPEIPPVTHTCIQNIRIKNTGFLADQSVSFSPYMNCIIGGRGSGKSTLFEYLRMALRQEVGKEEDEKPVDSRSASAKQIERVKKTVRSDSAIEAKVTCNGVEDIFAIEKDQPSRIISRDVDNPPTVFNQLRAIVFSQEEITDLANRQKTLLNFIDDLARDRLEPLGREADAIIDKLKEARQAKESLRRVDNEFSTLKQETSELTRQLEARTQVQEELRKHRAAQAASRYLGSVEENARKTVSNLDELVEELEEEPLPPGSRGNSFPDKDYYFEVDKELDAAYAELAANLRAAAERFRTKVSNTLSKHPRWSDVRKSIAQAETRFHAACAEKGLTIQEAEQLKETERQHRMKQAASRAKQGERDTLRGRKPDMQILLNELSNCWIRETRTRREILENILNSKAMRRTDMGEPIIRFSLLFAGNRKAFLKSWGKLAGDRRTHLGRIWDDYDRSIGNNNIGDQLFDAFQNDVEALENSPGEGEGGDRNGNRDPIPGNPAHWLEMHLHATTKLPPLIQRYIDEIKAVRRDQPDKWFDLLIDRPPDAADLTLLRSDGTDAGSFMKNELSTGQKNTAILTLLLARGNGPVFIDQPEDEFDNEFLYSELVPMLRNSKSRRQVIIVTHNANIPVNGDAELIYAFQAEKGRGVRLTEGGLDRPEVARAVLEIMEGSEKAFRRRKEKYHF